MGGMKISYLSVLVVMVTLLGGRAVGADTPLKVRATIIEMPRSPPCKDREVVKVVVLYRVERVLSGKLEGKRLLVMHRCPRIPRGSRRHGKGEAGTMRPGKVHLMTLTPLESTQKVLDRFTEEKGPRYRALVTDPAPPEPRIVVVVRGGAGTRHRLEFDGTTVSVGRSYTADVLLNDQSVAPLHLRLVVDGDKISVRPKDPARTRVRINKKRITRPTKITYKDRIEVGGYELRVALFLAPRSDA